MNCTHPSHRLHSSDDFLICSKCGVKIGISKDYVPDSSYAEYSFVQKKSVFGPGYSIRKLFEPVTGAISKCFEDLHAVPARPARQYVHAKAGPYSIIPTYRKHLPQTRLSKSEVDKRSKDAELLLQDIIKRMAKPGSCESRTSGRRGLRRKRRIPDNLHTPSNLDGTSPTGREMEPNVGPSVQGAGPTFNSTMPPVEAAPFANLDGTAIESTSCLPLHDVVESSTLDKCGSASFGIHKTTTDRESSRTDPTVPLGQPPLRTVLRVSSIQREIIPEDLEAAFAKHNFQISKILSKNTPFSAVVIFNNDEESYRALNSRIDYKGEVLSVSLANPKKERR